LLKPLNQTERSHLRAFLQINTSPLRCFGHFSKGNQTCETNAFDSDFCNLCERVTAPQAHDNHLPLIQAALACVPNIPTRRDTNP